MDQRVERYGLFFVVDQLPIVIDEQFLVLHSLREGLRVHSGVEADPGVCVDVVEPEVVHAVAIGLDVGVDAFAEEEGSAQVRCEDQGFCTPRTAPCLAPFRICGGDAEIQPLVVAHRFDLLDVRTGLAGQFGERPLLVLGERRQADGEERGQHDCTGTDHEEAPFERQSGVCLSNATAKVAVECHKWLLVRAA